MSIPDSSLFASSSADGCIKIWDASRMEGRNIANRSRYFGYIYENFFKCLLFNKVCIYINICYTLCNRQTYMNRSGPLVGLAVCEQGQSIASSASMSGTVFVLRIEPNSSKMSILYSRQLDLQVIYILFLIIYYIYIINKFRLSLIEKYNLFIF